MQCFVATELLENTTAAIPQNPQNRRCFLPPKKTRIAGHCDRTAGVYHGGSLSRSFFERPNLPQKGCGSPAAEVGGTGHGPAPVPQRRNLSSSKPRILPAFAVANLFAATILRFGNKTLKLRCQFVIFIISNKCTGVKFYLWDAFIYIHFPVLCGPPVSAEKKNAVCQLRP